MQPINIFIICEKIKTKIFFNKKTNANYYSYTITSNWIKTISYILINDIILNYNTLIDQSCISNMSNYLKNLKKIYKNIHLYTFINVYCFNLKIRLNILILTKKTAIFSIDSIYKNANWLERETSEMYGIHFFNKIDTRKLLLLYSLNDHPLLKSYPCEGVQEFYYDLLINQIVNVTTEICEL